MMEMALKRFSMDRSRTLMVGDRLDTDIWFGQNTNVDTLMVLTGVNTLDDVHHPSNTIKPTFIAPAVAALVK